jgi:hypothetical protein
MVANIKKPLTIKLGYDILVFQTLMYLVVSIRFLFCLVHKIKTEESTLRFSFKILKEWKANLSLR